MATIGGTASTELDAPVDAVWAIVADQPGITSWQRGITSVSPTAHDAEGRVTEGRLELDASVRTLGLTVAWSYDEPRRVSWTRTAGDVKSLEGSWTLEDLGGGRTRATYALEADPGRMLGMLLRGGVEEKVRRILVDGRPAELERRLADG